MKRAARQELRRPFSLVCIRLAPFRVLLFSRGSVVGIRDFDRGRIESEGHHHWSLGPRDRPVGRVSGHSLIGPTQLRVQGNLNLPA